MSRGLPLELSPNNVRGSGLRVRPLWRFWRKLPIDSSQERAYAYAMATRETAAIRKTETARRFTRGGSTRPECWRAETLDGVWDFVREESSGTPWLVYHNPSVADGSWPMPVMTCHSLTHCQHVVASGVAGRTLDAQKAEEAGS